MRMIWLTILSMAHLSLQQGIADSSQCTNCGMAEIGDECSHDWYDGVDECQESVYETVDPQFEFNFELVTGTSGGNTNTYNCTFLKVTCSGYGEVVLYATGHDMSVMMPVTNATAIKTSADFSELLTVDSSFLCHDTKYVHNRTLQDMKTIEYRTFVCKVMFTTPQGETAAPSTPSTHTPSTPAPSTPSTPAPSTPSTPAPSTPSTPTPSTPSTPPTPEPPTSALSPTTTAKCCPLKGIWSDWDEVVSPCSDTCGGCGAMTRRRRCLSESYGCKCTGPVQQMFSCAFSLCPSPRRMCCPTHPTKMLNTVTNTYYCGPLTFGEVVQKTTCCDPAGQGWNMWSTWSPPCPETCGNCGIRTRSRTCGSQKYGCPCKGKSEVSMHCSRPKPCAAPLAPCCAPSTLKRVNGTNKCVF